MPTNMAGGCTDILLGGRTRIPLAKQECVKEEGSRPSRFAQQGPTSLPPSTTKKTFFSITRAANRCGRPSPGERSFREHRATDQEHKEVVDVRRSPHLERTSRIRRYRQSASWVRDAKATWILPASTSPSKTGVSSFFLMRVCDQGGVSPCFRRLGHGRGRA